MRIFCRFGVLHTERLLLVRIFRIEKLFFLFIISFRTGQLELDRQQRQHLCYNFTNHFSRTFLQKIQKMGMGRSESSHWLIVYLVRARFVSSSTLAYIVSSTGKRFKTPVNTCCSPKATRWTNNE